jgi:hypothetical protein
VRAREKYADLTVLLVICESRGAKRYSIFLSGSAIDELSMDVLDREDDAAARWHVLKQEK